MSKLTLLTGGARSGKSSHALLLAEKYTGKKAFIATATALDSEMEKRITAHKKEREGKYLTIEEPYDLINAISKIPENIEVAVIDCLTVWLGNLFFKYYVSGDEVKAEGIDSEDVIKKRILEFVDYLDLSKSKLNNSTDLIIVTNEVGSGIVPENSMSRSYRDLAGILNCSVAKVADCVICCVCGIGWEIKTPHPPKSNIS